MDQKENSPVLITKISNDEIISLPEPTIKQVLCGLLMTFLTVVIFFCSS